MSRQFTFRHIIERSFVDSCGYEGEADIELEVTYSVTPYIPAQGPTYACGGQPAEGGDVELISVKLGGEEETLTDAEEDALIAVCEKRAAEDCADEAAAEADYRYEEYRNRQMMARWENEQ